jgi:esterase/lipase
LDKRGNKRSDMVLYVLQTALHRKLQDIVCNWGHCNPTCRIYMDDKKLMNQINYIKKHNKITEMEIEEIKREMQASQRSQLTEREEETLVYTVP